MRMKVRQGVKDAIPVSATAESGAISLNSLAKIDGRTTSRLRPPIHLRSVGNFSRRASNPPRVGRGCPEGR